MGLEQSVIDVSKFVGVVELRRKVRVMLDVEGDDLLDN